MTLPSEPEQVRAECIFGVQRLVPLLDAFFQEIEGVKSGQDIEYIHRMRVASRRLRAALPLFSSCIPEKKYRSWMLEIQRITRALGEARDTDVQIEFIAKLIKKIQRAVEQKNPSTDYPVRVTGDVETILLAQLQKRRSKLQVAVVRALEKLEGSGIIDDMRTFFISQTSGTTRTKKRSLPYAIPMVAAGRISRRLDIMLSYERWVHNPDAVVQHHAMRIAAKKLRYTMEVYGPLYRLGLKKYLVRVKKIQEILGDLHDCDVWIDTVMVILLKERSASPVKISSKNNQIIRMTGYRQFLAEREKERKRLYQRYVRYWDSLVRSGIWNAFRLALTEGRKRKYRFLTIPKKIEVRSSVSALAGRFPEVLAHSRKVTDLALTIFDDLAPLHQMGAHERFLLECACSLHDIGWKTGHKGHAKRSADMIVADEHLPLDLHDRGIIGLVAQAHSTNVRFESSGLFSLLTSKERDTVMMLASFIRIADGLDYLHNGSVESIHCSSYPEGVIIKISGTRDFRPELQRAGIKGDLFTQVFNRHLVIQ
jgi:CHAD domain-containing protein